jgi:predicted LPLAT superfamily acyltransferase
MARRPDRPSGGGRHQGWTSRSFGTALQHRIFYFFIRLGGRPAAYLLLYHVVGYYTLFRPSIRGRTAYYLTRRFPGKGRMGRLLDAYRLSLAFGKALVDRAAVGILGPDAMDVTIRGREEMLHLVARGRGLVLMTAHVGCWQASMSALHCLGVPVHLVMRRDEGEVDRHYFEHAGLPCPFRIIDPAEDSLGGTVETMQALKRGEVVCLMGDRVFGSLRNTLHVPFLGEPVRFPLGAFGIAAAAGAPVAVLFSHKTGPRGYELYLAATIEVPEGTGMHGKALRPAVTSFVEALEKFTQDHPYQFFNFYDLWSI